MSQERASLKEDSSNEAPQSPRCRKVLGAEVKLKPWAFLSEQKRCARGPGDPDVTVDWNAPVYSPNEISGYFQGARIHQEFPLRGGTLPVSFDR